MKSKRLTLITLVVIAAVFTIVALAYPHTASTLFFVLIVLILWGFAFG